MLLWDRFPVFRAFLALCAGIVLAHVWEPPFAASNGLLLLSLAAAVLLGFSRKLFFGYNTRWLFGLAINLCFFACGIVASSFYSNRHSPLHFTGAPSTEAAYLVELQEYPLEMKNSFGAKAILLGFRDSTFSAHNTQLMLYLAKSPAAANLQYGDRLVIKTRLNELKPPQNPYEFDYKAFLNRKAVYYQAYADSSSWSKVGGGHGNWLLAKAGQLRQKMLSVIDQWRLSPDEKAITKALLLGYRYDIGDDQMKAYASAGAMHVLAVSGLHTGIVYLMAFYALYFLTRMPYGSAIRMAVLILFLWFYACLTGLSPSVVRAATMFSFVAFGSAFQRNTSIYNTILGSAMLLLFIKPTYLFEVGFQLSYAAVFGIVWLQPKLKLLWKPPNIVLEKTWDIATVSVAAQIATFPLGLYYFHQFPTLFLLSNLAVIPLVTGLLHIGLTSLLLSALGYIPHLLIVIYHWLLKGMNVSVNWIEKQAFWLINEIHITEMELVLLYIMVLALCTWIMFGSYKKLVLALSAALLFSLSQLAEKAHLQQDRELVVYSVKDHHAVGIYGGPENYFLADSALISDENTLGFHIKNHWWARDANNICFTELETDFTDAMILKKRSLLHFGGYTYWFPKDEISPPQADFWIVFEDWQPPKKVEQVPSKVILGSQLDYWQQAKWKKWCRHHQVDLWDTKERGAFASSLRADEDPSLTASALSLFH